MITGIRVVGNDKIENKQIKEKEQKMNELYPNKRYIYCPYKEKDKCKSNGGKWDNDKKMWYIPRGIDNEPFKNWFYPYKNNNNYIEKQILYWFYYRYCNIDLEGNVEGSIPRKKEPYPWGIGKWLIWIDISSTNIGKLKYLNKKVGVTYLKIHQSGRKQFSEKEACICIYCGWRPSVRGILAEEEELKSFEEQKEWIKYIGFNISKDFYLKSISNENKIFFKTNLDTRKHKYSFNSKSSKFDINFY